MTIEQGCENLLQSLESLLEQGSAARASAMELALARGASDVAYRGTFEELVGRFNGAFQEASEQLQQLQQMLKGLARPPRWAD